MHIYTVSLGQIRSLTNKGKEGNYKCCIYIVYVVNVGIYYLEYIVYTARKRKRLMIIYICVYY